MTSVPGQIVRRGGISRTIFVISLVVAVVAAGLGGYFINAFLNPTAPTIELTGDGSSLVYPLLSQWTSNYHGLHSNIQVNYQSVGSGAGVTDFTNKVVDFAGTEAAPVPSSLPNTTLTIPETIGAVTLAYNIPGVPTGLNLNENLTAEIFNGAITYWDNASITGINNRLSLPHNLITTVHRSDSSGTTFIFEGYLLKSSFWPFAPQSKSWPSGARGASLAGAQNNGVATDVLTTPNSIGYVEVAYALQNNMNVAYVQNQARSSYIKPTLANITAAVNSADVSSLPTGLQDWSAVSLILQPGANSYPIVSFTYIIVYQQLNVRPLMTLDKAKALVDFIWYMVHEGQSAGVSLNYATLPASIVTIDETSIKSITYNGQSLPT
ncbi:phosphate ABC transporter substrate-binding protein PstS [archaeon 13_2_20CM_2_52_21]|nr:MAG: phosphate ABC transporter substrate-binding protein PstS [archaeon 13_2_20CM_2_52_21]